MRWCGVLFAMAVAAAAGKDTAREWNDLGLAASARGDYSSAEQAYRRSIEEWQALGPEYEAHFAITQINLGQAYCAQGKRREASELFESSLAKLRRTLGTKHELTITTMNLLAAVYLMLGEGARAEPIFQEALALQRDSSLPTEQLARTLQGLATININANQLTAALAQAEEALKIAIAADDGEGIDTAMAYATTAEVHRIAKRYERALPLYRKSRALYEKTFGAEHPRIASILTQEGLILMADGKYALAEKNMLRSLEIVKKACPGCTYELWIGECNLGLLRYRQKRYTEADVLLTHALEIQEKYMPRPNADMVGTIRALAATREKLRRHDEAARLNLRAKTLMLSFR